MPSTKMDLATNAVSTVAGIPTKGFADGTGSNARFNDPSGIDIDPEQGILYITDSQNHAIRKVNVVTGDTTTLAGLGGTAGSVDGTGTATLRQAQRLEARSLDHMLRGRYLQPRHP